MYRYDAFPCDGAAGGCSKDDFKLTGGTAAKRASVEGREQASEHGGADEGNRDRFAQAPFSTHGLLTTGVEAGGGARPLRVRHPPVTPSSWKRRLQLRPPMRRRCLSMTLAIHRILGREIAIHFGRAGLGFPLALAAPL